MNKHLFAPAAILLTAVALAACGNDSDKTAQPTTTVPAAAESATTNPTRAPDTAATTAPASRASSYALLWPFATEQAARTWMKDAAPGGHQPWRLDAESTALSFARDFLGYQGISRVSSTSIKADDAEIGVGFASDEVVGGLATAAVVHLIRIGGTGADAPWEVVGTADPASFTLTIPAYRSSATSPVTVGGSISGVDESIRVQVRQPNTSGALGEACCLAAGGTNSPWQTTVSFSGATDPFLTIAASTGGHIASVERFAVTGVRNPTAK
jgi:hypothetical protein